MTSKDFQKILIDKFPHQPTTLQEFTLKQLSDFIFSKERDNIFLLKGFAGTGKTTIIGSLVKHLWPTKMKPILLAPTGRAAKVISGYSETQALTIHKKIY